MVQKTGNMVGVWPQYLILATLASTGSFHHWHLQRNQTTSGDAAVVESIGRNTTFVFVETFRLHAKRISTNDQARIFTSTIHKARHKHRLTQSPINVFAEYWPNTDVTRAFSCCLLTKEFSYKHKFQRIPRIVIAVSLILVIITICYKYYHVTGHVTDSPLR